MTIDSLRAVMDQAAAQRRDSPPIESVVAHDRPTLVHLLDEAPIVPADRLLPGASFIGIRVVLDDEVPPDRLRFRHVDGRVFDHLVDGTVERVVRQ